jgi:hypothetical protein
MPGGDRTGPEGHGPLTGRAFGYCAGYNSPGYTKGYPRGRGLGFGRGFGRGWGRGLGRRRGFLWRGGYPPYEPFPYYPGIYPETDEDEESYLKNMVKELENQLTAVQDRLQELSKEK